MSDDLSVVLVAAHPPPASGQSVAAAMLRRQLDEHGVDVTSINLATSLDPRRLRRTLELVGVYARVLGAAARRGRGAVFYLPIALSEAGMLRDLPLLALARRMRWPTVLHIHGAGFRTSLDTVRPAVRRRVARALAEASRVIVLSPGLRSMLDDLVDPRRVTVVANGVPREVVRAAAAAAERHPPEGRSVRVLFLSNLIDTKGYTTVLRAAERAQAARRPYQFVIAGAPTAAMSVDPDRFVRDHDLTNVHVVGPVDGSSKFDVLASSDVLVLPTQYPWEGQPIVLLEAMAFGLPVVTTAVGAIPELIRDGHNGLLVPPDDPDAVLTALDEVLRDPERYRAISQANRDTADRHSEEAFGAHVLETLHAAAIDAPEGAR